MYCTDVTLYRNVRKDEFPHGPVVDHKAAPGVLYPSFQEKHYQTSHQGRHESRIRPADMTPYLHKGKSVVDSGNGASLFDREAVFGKRYWWHFRLPKGTIVPDSLRVRQTNWNSVYSAHHYQIEPASNRMPVEAYKGALDNFARNAVVAQYTQARTQTRGGATR